MSTVTITDIGKAAMAFEKERNEQVMQRDHHRRLSTAHKFASEQCEERIRALDKAQKELISDHTYTVINHCSGFREGEDDLK